jgi:hypothetical protein
MYISTEKAWAMVVPEIRVATFLKNSFAQMFRKVRRMTKSKNYTANLSAKRFEQDLA